MILHVPCDIDITIRLKLYLKYLCKISLQNISAKYLSANFTQHQLDTIVATIWLNRSSRWEHKKSTGARESSNMGTSAVLVLITTYNRRINNSSGNIITPFLYNLLITPNSIREILIFFWFIIPNITIHTPISRIW